MQPPGVGEVGFSLPCQDDIGGQRCPPVLVDDVAPEHAGRHAVRRADPYDVAVRSADTTPEVHLLQVAAHRALSPAERVDLAVAMSEDANAIAAAGIAARHPDYGDDLIEQALLRLRLGDELYQAVFPGAPLVDP